MMGQSKKFDKVHGQQPEAGTGASAHGSLITYPSVFPIKVMGANVAGFTDAIAEVAQAHDPQFDRRSMKHRASSKGNYLGVTITITATSREQLDNLYRALTAHPLVKVVL